MVLQLNNANKKYIRSLLVTKSDEDTFQCEGGKETAQTDHGGIAGAMLPKTQRKVEGKEAERVRQWLLLLGAFHGVALCCDIFLYSTMFSAIFSEIFYAWLCFYCFMTFSSMAIYIYIGLLFVGSGMGILSIFSAGGWFLIYIGQLAGYAFGAYQLFVFLKFYNDAKEKRAKGIDVESGPQKSAAEMAKETAGSLSNKIVEKASEKVAENIMKEGQDKFTKMKK